MLALRHICSFVFLCPFLQLNIIAAGKMSAAAPPNILFAIADDWGLHAGAYGTTWVKTPAFDRVADDGLLFNRAYTPNAKCAPSRASLLTGRNSWQLKAAANHVCYFPPEFKGWGEALAENGWFVGHTQKGWAPGVATNVSGRPREMTGRAYNKQKAQPPAKGISDNDYAANFRDFLDAVPPGLPWCFWYGAVEPHRSYEFGSGVAKGGKKVTDIDRVPGYWPDNATVRNDMLDYAFEVEHFDRHLGRMLATLQDRELLDNTLVIVTSDHGMPFPRVKGNTYDFANHVPLAVMWKRGIKFPGRIVDDYVSFIDIAPTLIELSGLRWKDTGMADSPGRSLVNLFRSGDSGWIDPKRDHVLLGRERTDIGRPHDRGYPVRGVVKGDWLYLRNFEPTRWPAGNPETGYLDCDGGATKTFVLEAHRVDSTDQHWAWCFGMRPAEELYNLKQDPDCLRNLVYTQTASPILQTLTNILYSKLMRQNDPRLLGQEECFDNYPYANPGQKGFYERFMKGEKVNAGWVNDSDFEKASIAQNETPPEKVKPRLPFVGKLRPRSAREIAGSDWSIGGETLDRDFAVYDSYKKYLGPLGAKAIRMQAGWAKCEKSPGVYDWKWLDQIVDDARSQGVQPWLELSYGNTIYPGGGGTGLAGGLPKSAVALAAWDCWVRALVRRYRDRVTEWEVWNEPDLGKENTPEHYAALFVRTARIIRSEQPAARVFALGLAGNLNFAAKFLDEVSERSGLDLIDAITIHGYPRNPDDLGAIDRVRHIIASHGAEIQVRQGETGAPSRFQESFALSMIHWSESTQAKWNLRRMLAHLAKDVPFNLFTMSDMHYRNGSEVQMNYKGLLGTNPDQTVSHAKAAYFAAQHVFAVFDHSLARLTDFSCKVSITNQVAASAYVHRASGAHLVALWVKDSPPQESNTTKAVDLTLKTVKFSEPVYVDLLTGNVFALVRPKADDVFRQVPLYDSPILIAERSVLPLELSR